MSLDANVRCPSCKAVACRRSKWNSSSERRLHPNEHPYRCRECSHRFHVRDRIAVRHGVVVSGALLGLAAVVAATATLLLLNFREPQDAETFAEATLIDPYTLRAAQDGDPAAQFRLARILLADPVPNRQNASEAVRWLRSAAERDHTGAMVQLGKLYRSGLGVLQDFGQAVKWIETAAVLGDADGMRELARLYRDGVGFDRDPVQAYIWFNRAAAALNPDAARERDDVARGLTDAQLKDAQRKSADATKVAAGNAAPGSPAPLELTSMESTAPNDNTD